MLQEEITVSESPKHTDTRQVAVTGSINIYVAVTDVDGSLLPYS